MSGNGEPSSPTSGSIARSALGADRERLESSSHLGVSKINTDVEIDCLADRFITVASRPGASSSGGGA